MYNFMRENVQLQGKLYNYMSEMNNSMRENM